MSLAGTLALLLATLLSAAAAPKPLQTFQQCTFIATPWADGDSFRIRTASGDEHTVRLYGVDCLELHLGDDRNLARFREQRRYFGIADAGGTYSASMALATALAREAADFTAKSLRDPFTLHTRFSHGGGDPAFKRILGFITLADGTDLGTLLVQHGLARTQGNISALPDGRSVVEARGMLDDWELQAMKKGRGIWARTNWEKLPAERQLQRQEKAEAKIAADAHEPSQDFKINPNTATREELDRLPGIGPVLADAILKARQNSPFTRAEDLTRVPGLKGKTLDRIRPYLQF